MVAALASRELGRQVNRKRAQRVMRMERLLQRHRPLRRRRRPGFFQVERPDQLWHLDMTSVWVAEHGWTYLNAAIDCCTREIVGWNLELRCRTEEAITLVDQAVVGLFLSTPALGLYVVGLAFANLPRFIAQSIGYIAYPRVAAQPEEQAWRTLWQFFWLAVGASGLVVLGLELAMARLVPLFFGDAFSGAVTLARILLVGALFLSARRVLTDGAQGLGRPGLGTIAEIASWAFLLPALAVFTPLWNSRGVAVALAVSSALSFAVLLVLLVRRRNASEPSGAPVLGVRGAE
jgi:hypothetical protein